MAILKAKATAPIGSTQTKEATNDAVYVALSSYLIPDAIAAETNTILTRLSDARNSLKEQYRDKFEEKDTLSAAYHGFVRDGGSDEGLRSHIIVSGDTDGSIPLADPHAPTLLQEMTKRHNKNKAEVDEAQKHNAKIKAKQAEIDRELTNIGPKIQKAESLYNTIAIAARAPLIFESASVISAYPPDKQLILLSVLTRGARASFDNGAYDTRDIRVVTELISANELVELIS